jgi:hypothetical protein
LNAHGVNDVRHAKTHTAEQIVPEHNLSEFEIAVEILKYINRQLLKKKTIVASRK